MLVRETLPVELGGCCRMVYTILSKTDLGAPAAAEGCCVAVAAFLATFEVLAGGLDLDPLGAAATAFLDLGDDCEGGMFSRDVVHRVAQ